MNVSCGGTLRAVYRVTGNNQPNIPSDPSPADHATGVSINADLSWIGGDPDAEDIVTYNVYFGTNSTPPLIETIGPYAANQTSISYDPGTLSYNTTYYWKIVARDDHGVTKEGSLWDFTTEVLLGDANGDGEVNMGDVTKVERIILTLDPPTPGADPNQDGEINMGDVTKIERIILGIDC